jgi:hypothetical protein
MQPPSAVARSIAHGGGGGHHAIGPVRGAFAGSVALQLGVAIVFVPDAAVSPARRGPHRRAAAGVRGRADCLVAGHGAASGGAKESAMPRGDKSAYTGKQKRQAGHIEAGYEQRGVPKAEAEATRRRNAGG